MSKTKKSSTAWNLGYTVHEVKAMKARGSESTCEQNYANLDWALGSESGKVPGLAGELPPQALRHLELGGRREDGSCEYTKKSVINAIRYSVTRVSYLKLETNGFFHDSPLCIILNFCLLVCSEAATFFSHVPVIKLLAKHRNLATLLPNELPTVCNIFHVSRFTFQLTS